MIPSNLDVCLYGDKIGSITYLGGDRSIFAFDESYIENSNRPTLGLSFRNHMGELITDFPSTQTHILPWFSNLLPEGPHRMRGGLAVGVRAQKSKIQHLKISSNFHSRVYN